MAVCRPAISCRTPVPVWNVPVWNGPAWNGPAVGGQGTGIARVSATGPTGCQLRLCRPDIPGRRFTPRPACLPADHPCIKPQTEPDCRAGLPDRKRRDQGTGQDGGQGRAVHGVVPGLPCGGLAGGVTGRTGPAHVNPVISHRHSDICPDETRGRAISPAQAGAGPRPGNNGVAPGEQDGTGKTGHPDRRRDLPDLIRRTGAGIPCAGPEHVPSREGFFAAGHAGIPDIFFTAGIAQIPARPLRRFPRAFREGHFVSSPGAISFQMTRRKKFPEWLQSVVGDGNLKRNEMQKNRHAEVGRCGT